MSKVIEINPDFLSLGVKKPKKKKLKKEKVLTRRKMLQNIMNLRKEKENDDASHSSPPSSASSTEDDPLHDLNEFVKDYKRRLTLKKKKNITVPVLEGDMSDKSCTPGTLGTIGTPQYSCLKGSSKPTYKQLNKTIRNRISFPENVVKSTTCIDTIDTTMKDKYKELFEAKERIEKEIETISDKGASRSSTRSQAVGTIGTIGTIGTVSTVGVTKTEEPCSTRTKTRKITKTCKVGKDKEYNKVHIIVPNRHTRKRETTELDSMNNMPLSKVKQYLRSRMLIHNGCDAPEHILREMMRSVILSGDVHNRNKEHILKDLMENI